MDVSPILLEVFKNRFTSVAEEMGVALMRTAYSPNIKERRDFSCAIFDRAGGMIAQAAHIPVHLGSMPLSVKAAIEAGPLAPGDMVVLNDPFRGGTHLPDITLTAPVFFGSNTPCFYAANRAHHADVGGMTPGSMPLSTSLFQEGIVIPPLKLVEKGVIDRKMLDFFLSNVRTPLEREGDFAAQIMANLTGVRRLEELLNRHGLDQVDSHARALMDYAEKLTRNAIGKIPPGEYFFEDFLDDDGLGTERIPIRLTMKVAGDRVSLDFSESGAQVRGGINAVRAIAVSAALYVFRSLIEEDVPANAGALRAIEVITRPGTILDAVFPAAVAGGNVETSQRIVDVILGALAQALPEKIPAASQGTMNNLTLGGFDPRVGRPFAYYETLAGGMGGSPNSPGQDAVHSHMTNTLNTPIEALEYAYPFLMTEYSIRRGSGGAGRRPGGDGLVRELQVTAPAEVVVISERRTSRPYGLSGGAPGLPGRNFLIFDGAAREMPGKFSATLEAGDAVRIETPGGGGWGRPRDQG
ncbi:MAG: hydantoinase B/oxoprolinase family protein [Pseudomonadota bacterium]